ncbi:MAG: hypothetical protein AMS21_09905 [Gemmatimonas sp. SG8_38_2]|nr:MAG: hypothetical protein AMS21_09905 [Gemmatimonas sp. SG8_38_2]
MLKKKAHMVIGLALGLVAGIACSDDETPAGPTAGTLSVTLATPNMDDGAILFEVTGPDIVAVTVTVPELYTHVGRDGSTLTIVVVGDIASGLLVGFDVPDVGAVASYGATVLQVADRTNAPRGALSGYNLTVE